MNFHEVLKTDSSRKIGEMVANEVRNNPEKFKIIYNILMEDIPQVSSRAGRVLLFCCEKYPELLRPYLKEIINNLAGLKNEGALRTLLRTLTLYKDITEEEGLGLLYNTCYNFILANDSATATKTFSLQILFNICLQEPDLKFELVSIIEHQMPKNEKAFKARATMILKELNKL